MSHSRGDNCRRDVCRSNDRSHDVEEDSVRDCAA